MKNLLYKFALSAVVAGMTTFGSLAHAQSTFTETADGVAGGEIDENTASEAAVFFTPSSDLLLTGLGAWAGSFTNTTIGGLSYTTEPLEVGLYDVTDNDFLFNVTVPTHTLENSQGFAYSHLPIADYTSGKSGFILNSGDEYEVVDFGGPYGLNVDDYRGSSTYSTPFKRDRIPGYGSGETLLQAGPGVTLDAYSDTFIAINSSTQDATFQSTPPGVSYAPVGDVTVNGHTVYYGPDTPLDTGVVGPNIEYTDLSIPEPSDFAYLSLGGAVLFFALRRRTAAPRE